MPTSTGKLAGADIVISIKDENGVETVLGQRNIKIKTSTDEIDFSTRPEAGYQVGVAWLKEKGAGMSDWGVDLDGVVKLSGITSGFVKMLEAQFKRIECDVVITFADEATATGKGFIANMSCDAPYDKEATFTGNLFGSSQLEFAAI